MTTAAVGVKHPRELVTQLSQTRFTPHFLCNRVLEDRYICEHTVKKKKHKNVLFFVLTDTFCIPVPYGTLHTFEKRGEFLADGAQIQTQTKRASAASGETGGLAPQRGGAPGHPSQSRESAPVCRGGVSGILLGSCSAGQGETPPRLKRKEKRRGRPARARPWRPLCASRRKRAVRSDAGVTQAEMKLASPGSEIGSKRMSRCFFMSQQQGLENRKRETQWRET